MIGAHWPKPLIPIWTTVPLVTATSGASGPQAPLIVGMSTPWSFDHHVSGATRLIGVIGNTQSAQPAGSARDALRSAFTVRRPTTPVLGDPWSTWKRFTRLRVRPSNTAVTTTL